ncbi:MAG TPA: haloacid dehalogenase type II [Caulobacteraceae bacterium]|nr:haloacid dehalogenase type II [Caulobacteraceae bacterium]
MSDETVLRGSAARPSGRAIKALTFDVFGTVVDWRSSIAREAEVLLAPKGLRLDWGDFADRWRALYQPAMQAVRSGERPFVVLDELHRENLLALLGECGIVLSGAEVEGLNRAWHRLDPWPDVIEGLGRLKPHFVLATLSNGNVALMVNMARRAGLAWDVILGAEVARAYKPEPRAYDCAALMLGLEPAECLMVAAHPADLRAAAARGFRTAYVHRPLENGSGREPQRPPDAFDYCADDLIELAGLLEPRRPEV